MLHSHKAHDKTTSGQPSGRNGLVRSPFVAANPRAHQASSHRHISHRLTPATASTLPSFTNRLRCASASAIAMLREGYGIWDQGRFHSMRSASCQG